VLQSQDLRVDQEKKPYIGLLELKMIDLVSILVSLIFFYFLLGFIIDHKTKKIKCDTITGHMTRSHKSHAHVT